MNSCRDQTDRPVKASVDFLVVKKQRSRSFCAGSQLRGRRDRYCGNKCTQVCFRGSRGGSFVKGGPPGRLFSLELSGKCVMYLRGILRNVEGREVFGNVQHWQTSLRRLHGTRPVRVRAAAFTGSISSLLPQRNSPREADTAIEIFRTNKFHRRSCLLVEQHKLSSPISKRPFHLDHLLLENSRNYVLQRHSTSFQMEIGMYTFYFNLLHIKCSFLDHTLNIRNLPYKLCTSLKLFYNSKFILTINLLRCFYFSKIRSRKS